MTMDIVTWVPLYALYGAGLLLLLMGAVLAAVLPGIDRVSKNYFVAFFSLLMLSAISTVIDAFSSLNPDYVTVERGAIFAEWLLISVLMPTQTAYLLSCCGEDWRSSRTFHVACTLWCAYFLILVIAQFTTAFYYVESDNSYVRGPLHALLMILLLAMAFISLVALVRRRDRLSRKYHTAFLVYLIPMIIGMVIHTFVYAIEFVFICLDICALVMFILILSDQIEHYTQQQREIAQQKAHIMVLQMRPHFIYNTMSGIYYLCEQDPKKAQQVTLDFTTYLRQNFTAIVSEDVIPFSRELEHTRAYLAVEQAQYDDSLLVDYDTPHTQFHLPPLTLQPIVENAVKHAMDPDAGPLHIWIRTRETPSGSEIVVEDDGVGFGPAEDPMSHGALANIKQRLEMMCHGAIQIMPRSGGGTVVRIRLRE